MPIIKRILTNLDLFDNLQIRPLIHKELMKKNPQIRSSVLVKASGAARKRVSGYTRARREALGQYAHGVIRSGKSHMTLPRRASLLV